MCSVFLPTHRAGPEVEQGPIRLKNLLRQATEALKAIVEPLFLQAVNKAAVRYHQLTGTGLTSREPQEIVRAAEHGRVDTLFAARQPAGPSADGAASRSVTRTAGCKTSGSWRRSPRSPRGALSTCCRRRDPGRREGGGDLPVLGAGSPDRID